MSETPERTEDAPGEALAPGAERFQRLFLLTTALGITLLFLWMVRAFLVPLLLAAIFAGLMGPLYRRVLRWVGGRDVVASLLVVLAVLLLVLGPVTAFLGVVAGQALQVTESVGPWVERQLQGGQDLGEILAWVPFADDLPWLEGLAPERDQLVAKAGEAISRTGSFLVSGLAAFTKGTATFFLDLFILLYAMFFFLRGGGALLDRILHYVPLRREDEDLLIDRFTSVTRATLKGSLLIGVAQGGLAGLAFAAAGIPAAAFWATVMAVLSVIPGIGAPIVWLPAAIWLFADGQVGTAVALTVWCGAVVGSIDNVLRPRLVGSDARMPDLLILLGTLGGIALFGPIGFILGPIVAGLFVTIWEFYGRAFGSFLPPATREAESR